MALSCSSNIQNVGRSDCKLTVEALVGFIKTASDFTIAVSDLTSATALQAAILADPANRIYLFPTGVDFVDNSEESILEETNIGKTIPVRKGQYRWDLSFNENFQLHKAMATHDNSSGKAIFIDKDLKLFYQTTDANVTAKGFDLDLFQVQKLKINDGTVSTKTMISLRLQNSLQIDTNGELVDASSWLDDLIPLTTLDVTEVSSSTSNIVVDVKSNLDARGLSGLVVGDFAAGTVGSITSATPDSAISGRYDLAAATTFANGNVQLIAANLLSIVGFEQKTPLAITGL